METILKMDETKETKETKSSFNVSKYMTSTTIHIAIEVILACVIFAYLNRKINNQKTEYENRITSLEEQVKDLATIVSELSTPENYQPPVSKKAPSPTAAAAPMMPNIAMDFFQEFMAGPAVEQINLQSNPRPRPKINNDLSSIVEVEEEEDDEPVSREQLDKELSQELGELESKPAVVEE